MKGIHLIRIIIAGITLLVLTGCGLMIDGQPVDGGSTIALGSGELMIIGLVVVAMFALARKD